LALEAAQKALTTVDSDWQAAAASLDMVMVATVTPDHNGCPATACIVQDKLGAKRAGAMDVSAGCTGFIYALETAAGLLGVDPGRKRALVIGADLLSRVTDWTDRGSCVLFGDGAGAVVLEKTANPAVGPDRRGILKTILGADGSGAEHLIIRRGGSRYPFKTGETVEKPPYLEMNGRAVYNFAVKAITETVEKLLAAEGIKAEDLAWIVPHQANARIVQAAAKRLGIPEEKFFLNMEEYANTSGATIPIALAELNRDGKLHRGDLILTVGFGGGLTYGGNLIVW
jgi:3-oxoacyl-[acyl-carrier-protein] synthase-3